MRSAEEILAGLWRFTGVHPEWEEGDGWDPDVAWWAVLGPDGLVLIDPLPEDWDELDRLVQLAGGCPGILRTLHFHERSIPEASRRYGAAVWARTPRPGVPKKTLDHPIGGEQPLPGGLRAFEVNRDDEVAVWLPEQRALAFGDAMLRDPHHGRLELCPESWVDRSGGRAGLRQSLTPLLELEPVHVLVSHGPLVLGGGSEAMAHALVPES